MCTVYESCTGVQGTGYTVQGVSCGVHVAYVACLEADTSSVRLAVRLAVPLERLATGWLAAGWLASGWLAGGWVATGWLATGWLATGWLAVLIVWCGIVIGDRGLGVGGVLKSLLLPPL